MRNPSHSVPNQHTGLGDGNSSSPTDASSGGIPSLRRQDAPSLSKVYVQTEDELSLRLAEELEYLQRILEYVGGALVSNPNVVFKYKLELQQFDICGQSLGHLAKVIRSAQPYEAVKLIGMTDLRARLLRQSIKDSPSIDS